MEPVDLELSSNSNLINGSNDNDESSENSIDLSNQDLVSESTSGDSSNNEEQSNEELSESSQTEEMFDHPAEERDSKYDKLLLKPLNDSDNDGDNKSSQDEFQHGQDVKKDEFLQNLLDQSIAYDGVVPNSARLEPAETFVDSDSFIRPKNSYKGVRTIPFQIQGERRDMIKVAVKLFPEEKSFTSLRLYNGDGKGSYRKGERVKNGKISFKKSGGSDKRMANFYVHLAEWKVILQKIEQREQEMKKLPVSKKGTTYKPVTYTKGEKEKEDKIRVFVVSDALITDGNQIRLSEIALFHTRVSYSKVSIIVRGAPVELNGFRFSVGTDPETLEKLASYRPGKYSDGIKQSAALGDYLHKNAAELYEKGEVQFLANHDIPLSVRPQDVIELLMKINGVKGEKKKPHFVKVIVSASTIRDVHLASGWKGRNGIPQPKQTVADFGRFYSGKRPADMVYVTELLDPNPKFIGGWLVDKATAAEKKAKTLNSARKYTKDAIKVTKSGLGDVKKTFKKNMETTGDKRRYIGKEEAVKLIRDYAGRENLQFSRSDMNKLVEWVSTGGSFDDEETYNPIFSDIMNAAKEKRDAKQKRSNQKLVREQQKQKAKQDKKGGNVSAE